MKETGIIFSGEMVRAILDGRKTVTRRLRGLEKINSIPECYNDNYPTKLSDGSWVFWHHARPAPTLEEFALKAYPNGGGIKCPYGDKGDLLYGKEAMVCIDGWAHYEADMTPVTIGGPGINEGVEWEWKRPRLPGMFMPKWASRLPLVNEGSGPERLQDIRTRDILKEGYLIKTLTLTEEEKRLIRESKAPAWAMVGHDSLQEKALPPMPWFIRLWDSINPRYPWESNPVVWRIEFRRAG